VISIFQSNVKNLKELPKQNRFLTPKFLQSVKQKNIIRYNRPKSNRKWLPRNKWLRRKQLLQILFTLKHQAWLARRAKWKRRNKRPFWKRKSFKRIRAEQYIVNNLFFVSKKLFGTALFVTKKWRSKKILYRRYYRSNTVRRDFKTRIILRHYWKFRYGYDTHDKLKSFLKSVKKRSQRLLRFFHKFELALFRYVRWWGLIPTYCNDRLARYFVTHGYIYVNFLQEVNPMYKVCAHDCIFSVAPARILTNWFMILNYTPSYGKVKHLSGRKEFIRPFKSVCAPVNAKFYRGFSIKKQQFRKSWISQMHKNRNQLYLKLRSMLSISSWSPIALLHYSLLLEISYKIRVLIPLFSYNWFAVAFGAVRGYNDINTVLTNKFISCSYF